MQRSRQECRGVDKACRGVDKETEKGRIMQKSKTRRKSGQGLRILRSRDICIMQRSRQGVIVDKDTEK